VSRVAADVRREKERRPHLFCAERSCLWRLASGPCPRHPDAEGAAAARAGRPLRGGTFSESPERAALLALVRWVGEYHQQPVLPVHLHAQIRDALGDDFYRDVTDDA
jgi:hypothetical protein